MYGYYVVDWGEPVGFGRSKPRYCSVAGVAKQDFRDAAYTVSAQFVAMRLGTAIGLPIPPGAIVLGPDGNPAYACFRVHSEAARPVVPVPEIIVADNPVAAAGIALFDIWMANTDRKRGLHVL